jgi:hypothetical protein
MRRLLIVITALVFLTGTVYAMTPEQKEIIGKIRLAEDAIWLFASVFLVFFSYQLKVIYEGGEMEDAFKIFVLAFSLLVLWKFLGVTGRIYGIDTGLVKELVGEAGSGFVIGGAYSKMWHIMKGE